MARKKTVKVDEQMDLIDVAPEDAKVIIEAARLYKKLQTTRLKALEREVDQKQKVKDLIRQAKLQPLDGGVIKFKHDGVTIEMTPRDEKLTIKEDE